ncbi:D-hexose-6-phosphate mutarotase [Verrucomicrobiaceae bacterium N1E253]|uniref:Putative glucose-6-phosphate 1-epimerase n=1 Tax=Oceaniferula marina TaxID=2748318 RepID=A0A851GFY0_9BACT|nr:D-hexose-6-phosphate mutarotase [Oceaniferula marina]NWK56423.1 D-hexose-6-phosphate mutarotase [Oceaniferula marina]
MPVPHLDLSSFGLPDILSLEEPSPGYPVIRISNPFADACIALHGAHLTHFAPQGEEPVIFTSQDAVYREGKAIRGGIPVCWPWFGAHPDGKKNLPAHGYARTTFWHLVSVKNDASGTHLLFSLPPQADKEQGTKLSATLEFSIGQTLTLKLTSNNISQNTQRFSEALHTYFAVDDSRHTEVSGLDGDHYIDTTGDKETRKTQSGPVGFPGEIDRIYHSSSTLTVREQTKPRAITINKDNSQSSIIWNPGEEKGSAMGDLANDEITRFICAESANVREQSIELAAGASHTLTFNISTQA